MKLTENKTIAMIAVAAGTILLQFPNIGDWYGRVSKEHTHLVTIVEGIIGVVMLFFATKKPEPDLNPLANQAQKPGGQK